MEGSFHFHWNRDGGSPLHKLMDSFLSSWPDVWKQIPQEERVSVIMSIAKDHLGDFLVEMSREDRVSLMNGLLPIIAREFPLADIDVLSIFSPPDDLFGKRCNDSEKHEPPNH